MMINIKKVSYKKVVLCFALTSILCGAMSAFNAHVAQAESGVIGAGKVLAVSLPASQTNFNCDSMTSSECLKKNPIVVWLNWGLSFLSALVGVGAIIMTIVAGLQYSAARDNPQGVQAAKQKIMNVVLGLAAYIFLWAFLQWLVPGGVF